MLGPAAIAADGYFRYDSVMDTYNSGGNWKRELFAESMGFTVGITLSLLGFSLLFGPLGWVAAFILAGGAAVFIDKFTVVSSKRIYDWVGGY